MVSGFANLVATQSGALAVSIAVEATAAAVLAPLAARGRLAGIEAAARGMLAATLATLLTHGAVWDLAIALAEPETWVETALALEAAVVAIEAVVWRALLPVAPSRCLGLSALANAASTGVGLLLAAA